MFEDSDIQLVETQVYYLRMNERPNYEPCSDKHVSLSKLTRPVDPKYYLELYQGVGLRYSWLDRLLMPELQLERVINEENNHIYLMFAQDDPCGFMEIQVEVTRAEIMYFGLFPEFLGKGLGAPCLKKAVTKAWDFDPEWLEINTCDLDSDRALNLYMKVGFDLYNERTERRRIIG
jgi:GNAT superfamily N-acetyltransferase